MSEEKLPNEVKDIQKEPILKPLLDYQQAALILEREDESETTYLKESEDELKELLNGGYYKTSAIANTYEKVVEKYKRLLFIMSRYTAMADKEMINIRKVVNDYYVSKEKLEEINNKVKELEEQNINLKKENINLKNETENETANETENETENTKVTKVPKIKKKDLKKEEKSLEEEISKELEI